VAYAFFGGSGGVAVPQVNGLSEKQATEQVQKAGLTPKIVDQSSATVAKGLVITTSPANGNLVAKGTTVTLFVSNGPPQVKVPNVLHQNEPDARNLLINEGFKVHEVTDQNSAAKPNTVVGQSPAPNTLVNKGATVTLSVSPGGSQVPNVVGEQVAIAQGQLANAGFTNVQVNEVSSPGVQDGVVTGQNPTAGQLVPTSTTIILQVVKNQPTPTPTPTTPTPTPTSTSTSGTVPPTPGGRHS
jgi:serine/threonine-protein kinase